MHSSFLSIHTLCGFVSVWLEMKRCAGWAGDVLALAGRRRTALGQYLKGTGWIRGEGLEDLMVKTRPFIYILTELPAQHT